MKHAFITGGGGDIGAAIGERATAAGYRVTLVDQDGERARQRAKLLEGAIGLQCDVSDEASVEAAFDAATSQSGAVPDLVVNCAGIARFAPLLEHSLADFRRVIDINLVAMREVRDMSVLITGGGSGIGEATARLFAERGARVTITGRRKSKIDAVAQDIGPACRAVAGDVTLERDRKAMLAAAVEHGGKLDVLVNNAANMYRQAVGEYTEEFLKEAFNSNVISGMMLSSMAVPLLEQTRGAIIFLGSIHNRRAYPGASPYATTKAAVEGLTRVMAAELGRRQIRVCCVLPGAVSTEINLRAGLFTAEQALARYAAIAPEHALGRIGTATEVAEAIEYLVRAEWVTGVALEVDGGLGLGVSSF